RGGNEPQDPPGRDRGGRGAHSPHGRQCLAHLRKRERDGERCSERQHRPARAGESGRLRGSPHKPGHLIMSSIGSLLSIAGSALSAHQAAIVVTSNNVSNADTVGYSRQTAVLAT